MLRSAPSSGLPRSFVVSAVALLVSLGGCNTALHDAMGRAESAHKRGDHFGEAVALRDACRAAPDEVEVCRGAKASADEVIAHHLPTLETPCASDAVACLTALEVLSPFAGAQDPRLTPFFDRAGTLLADGCETTALQAPEDAVFLVRCEEAYAQRVPTAGYAARVSAARQRAAQWFDAQAAQRSATPGVAWLYGSMASCLGGAAQWAPRAQAFRASFDEAHAYRLTVSGRSPVEPAALCGELARQAGGVVRCDGRGGPALGLQVEAWADEMTDSAIREVRSVQVLDHTEQYENPDYRYAQSNVRHARNRSEDAEKQARLADADCSTARSALSQANYCYNCSARSQEQSSCNHKDAAADIERHARSELNDAEQALSNTPSYLTREIFRTESYRTALHRFTVPWHVRVTATGSAPRDVSGAMHFETTEREGVPAAGIGYLPYSEPGPGERTRGLAALTVEQATAALTAELELKAQALTARCPAPGEWSDCQVEASLLRRTDPVAQFVSDVGVKLDARTGQAWPKASCLP